MHQLTLALPDDLYAQLQAKAAREGIPLEGFIVKRLAAEVETGKPPDEEKCRLHEVLSFSGLLQISQLRAYCYLRFRPFCPSSEPCSGAGETA
jgi:hypothetical protein